ncbi:MAG: sulfotransferase [Nitrososphaerales archaeon]
MKGPHDLVMISAERLSGHAASGGYDSVRIADRLMATLPEAIVFWFLRHQSEAIRSEYKQLVRAGWTGKVSKTMDPAVRRRTTGFDVAYWEYDRLVSAYVARFGHEKVLVLDYGAFTQNSCKSLDEIAAFLGIDQWKLRGGQLTQRVNVSKSDREMRFRQVLNHYTRSEFNPYPPFELPARLRMLVVKQNVLLPDSYRLFGESFDDWVETRYRDSNRKLLEDWQIRLTRSGTP